MDRASAGLEGGRLEDLAAGDELHEALLRAQSDLGIGLVVVEGEQITHANDAFLRLVGRDRDGLGALGSFFDLVPSDLQPALRQGWALRLEGRTRTDRFEAAVLREDGQRMEVEVAVKRLPGEGFRLLAVVRDITPRKHAEEAHRDALRRLQEERELLECVLRSLPDAVYVADHQGLRFANAVALAQLGLDALGEQDRPLAAVARRLQPRDSLTLAPVATEDLVLERALRGEPNAREVVVRDAGSGEDRLLQMVGAPVEVEGRILAAVAVAGDVTERRRYEVALRASEERFRHLFDESPLSIQVFDPDGTHRSSNPAWERLWDAPRSALEGYNLLRDPLLEALGVLPQVRLAFAGERVHLPPTKYDPALLGRPGRARWVETFLYPLRDGGQRVREVVLLHQDVTEHKAAEEAMRAANERLEELGQLRTQFFNTVAHELRTPMTPILLQLELLRRAPLAPPHRQALDVVDRAVERLNRLLDDVLDAARVEAGKLSVNPEPVDLPRVVREAEGIFTPAAQQAGVRLVVDAPATLPVDADPQRLAQVLFNLLSNALKFTASGGEVRVVVRPAGDEVRVEVRDTGLGLRPEEAAQLFRPFVRVAENEGPKRGGTGLGLFISKGIVEQHGGRIGVTSEGPGRGSTFWFVLPLRPPPWQ